jgi:cytoskeletal protein RodZ
VGIDEDEAVAQYLEAAQEPPPDNKVIAHQHAFHSDRRPERAAFPVIPVLILVVVVLGAVGGWKAYQEHQKDRERPTVATAASMAPSAAMTPQASSTLPTTAGSMGTPAAKPSTYAPPAQAAPTGKPASAIENRTAMALQQANAQDRPAAGGEFEVTIRPKERAWVSVKSDGRYVVRGIIKPPDVKTIRASSEVVFYTGNAGEVDLAFNGKSVPLSGGANQQATVVFGSKGMVPRAPAE